jgi:hypothetical protein
MPGSGLFCGLSLPLLAAVCLTNDQSAFAVRVMCGHSVTASQAPMHSDTEPGRKKSALLEVTGEEPRLTSNTALVIASSATNNPASHRNRALKPAPAMRTSEITKTNKPHVTRMLASSRSCRKKSISDFCAVAWLIQTNAIAKTKLGNSSTMLTR